MTLGPATRAAHVSQNWCNVARARTGRSGAITGTLNDILETSNQCP